MLAGAPSPIHPLRQRSPATEEPRREAHARVRRAQELLLPPAAPAAACVVLFHRQAPPQLDFFFFKDGGPHQPLHFPPPGLFPDLPGGPQASGTRAPSPPP